MLHHHFYKHRPLIYSLLLMIGCISFLSSLIYASGTRVTINIIENPNLTGQNKKNISISERETQSIGISTGNISGSGTIASNTSNRHNNNIQDSSLTSLKVAHEYPLIGNVKKIINLLKIRVIEERKNTLIETGSGEVLNLVIASDSGTINPIGGTSSLFSKISLFIRRSVISYDYSLLEAILSTIKGYPMNILSLTVFKTAAFTDLFGFR